MMDIFENVKKKFGFGCMRLPMKGSEVDKEEFSEMVDTFLENGFNYFDTAHGYLGGLSETALRECLTSRYPRDRYILTDKLTNFFFKTEEDIRPFFESQLEACGVDYFDFYLMHAQSADNFAFFKKCRAYETALELKKEGKIRHFGISFHDRADVLEQMEDNISYMKDFTPLSETEKKAIDRVREIFQSKNLIQCTACRYCTAGGPKQISIPDLFACMNAKKIFHDWNTDYYYNNVHTVNNGKASDCIKCGKCEKACPQHLPIRQLLQRNYCVFWLKDQTNYYIEEFAGILRKLLL